MKTIKILRNSAGIGLVEVMMAIAITGGLTLTIAKLMENAGQSAKQIEAKSENTSLKGIIQDVLNNTTACSNTFGTVMSSANVTALSASTSATVTVPNIKDKLNVIKYSTASTNISPLTITSMELTNYNALAYTGDMVVNSTFRKSSSMVMMVKPIRIPINFSFTAGSLTACSTMAVGGEWLLGGNAGTVDGSDYVGTSDTSPLNFKVNAQKSGRIDTTGQAFFGYLAGGNFNKYSTSGTGFGYEALKGSPYWNLATGNSAFGTGTLKSIVNGAYNTAIGWNALVNIYTSSYNTAVGAASQAYLTSGSSNTSLGYAALKNSVIGSNNTGVGESALFNNGGNSNTGIGNWALMNNSSGSYNTSLGDSAGYSLVTGSNNLFLGYNAGLNAGVIESKLYIETTGNTTPLIGGDFSSAGRYVTVDGTVKINGTGSIAMKMTNGHAIRTHTAASTDKVYFDTRTLFRDGASGGNGFVGIAGGLGIGSGTWWNASVVPAQGNVQIEGQVGIGTQTPLSKLVVNGPGSTNYSGAATQLGTFYTDVMTDGMIGVNSTVNPGTATSWTYAGRFVSNSASTIGGKSVGVRGQSYANSVGSSGRTYGVWGMAGNATAGWNYGVYGEVIGSNAGAGIFGTATAYEDGLQTTSYRSGMLAAFFHGDTVTVGTIYATSPGVSAYSDRRLKKNIKPLQNSLEKILKIEGVNYDWKQDTDMEFEKGRQIGLIAQNVEEQFPLAVKTSVTTGGEFKSVSYTVLIAPLIESVKELYKKIVALFDTVSKQSQEIAVLKAENEKLNLALIGYEARLNKLENEKAKPVVKKVK